MTIPQRSPIEGQTVMTAQARPSLAAADLLGTSQFCVRLGTLRSHLAAWVGTCADYYRAAALYDDLSRLSDAELRRRGLSRSTLARDLSQGCDRTNS
jgi:hypothetical protein